MRPITGDGEVGMRWIVAALVLGEADRAPGEGGGGVGVYSRVRRV